MVRPAPEPLDDDGLNATRALILHAYYGLRASRPADVIGTREIVEWLDRHRPDLESPSPSLVRLTLVQANVTHRGRGQPSRESRIQGETPSPPLSIFAVKTAPRDE